MNTNNNAKTTPIYVDTEATKNRERQRDKKRKQREEKRKLEQEQNTEKYDIRADTKRRASITPLYKAKEQLIQNQNRERQQKKRAKDDMIMKGPHCAKKIDVETK